MSGTINQSAGDEDLVTNGAAITNAVEVTNTYTTDGRINLSADKTINGRLPVYFTDKTFNYYLKEVAWAQYDTSETAAEGSILDNVQDVIRTYRLNGSTRYAVNFNDNSGKGYKVTNTGNGTIAFPTLLWESGVSGYKGYRVYTLREVYMVEDPETGNLVPDEQRPGYEDGMDTTVYVVWVELRDNKTGMLETRINYYKLPEGVYEANVDEKDTWIKLDSMAGLHFDNTYKAEGDMKIRLKKTINGIAPVDGPFKHQKFQYTLTYNSAEGSKTLTAENNGEGWADFDLGLFMGDTGEEQMFIIDDVGSNQFFRYILTENMLDEAGTTIDTVEYAITIQITDQGSGRLGAKVDIVATRNGTRVNVPTVTISRLPRRGDNAYDTELQSMLSTLSQRFTFDNKYEASGQWQTGIRKLINGTLIDTTYYKNNTFTFTLSELVDNQEKKVSTIQNGADGTGLFPEIDYTQADIGHTYTYVIHETGTAGDGVTLNDTPWTITLRIDDQGEGKLLPVVTEVKQGSSVVWPNDDGTAVPPSYDFDNPYDASGSIEIEATKKMTGRALLTKEFTFQILDENAVDEEGQPTVKVVATGTNDQDGKVTFSAINYTLKDVGTHVYKVVEVKGDTAGVFYDGLGWTVVVTVADKGDGTLATSYETTGRETE